MLVMLIICLAAIIITTISCSGTTTIAGPTLSVATQPINEIKSNEFIWNREALPYHEGDPIPAGYTQLGKDTIIEEKLQLGAKTFGFKYAGGLYDQKFTAPIDDTVVDNKAAGAQVTINFDNKEYIMKSGDEVQLHPYLKVRLDMTGNIYFEDGKVDWKRTGKDMKQKFTFTFDLKKGLPITGNEELLNTALNEEQKIIITVNNDFWDWPAAGIKTEQNHVSLWNPNPSELKTLGLAKGKNDLSLTLRTDTLGSEYYTIYSFIKITTPTTTWLGINYEDPFKKTVSIKQDTYFTPPSNAVSYEPKRTVWEEIIASTKAKLPPERNYRLISIWVTAGLVSIIIYWRLRKKNGKKHKN